MHNYNGKQTYEKHMLDHIGSIERCLLWYRTQLSPKLSSQEKHHLRWRIHHFQVRNFPLEGTYPASDFPELKEHCERGFISALELVILQRKLHEELGAS